MVLTYSLLSLSLTEPLLVRLHDLAGDYPVSRSPSSPGDTISCQCATCMTRGTNHPSICNLICM